jgi:tRNA G10  N-methylase Trm11
MTGALLLWGDARRLPLADNSVDLIVTSPPCSRAARSRVSAPGQASNALGRATASAKAAWTTSRTTG